MAGLRNALGTLAGTSGGNTAAKRFAQAAVVPPQLRALLANPRSRPAGEQAVRYNVFAEEGISRRRVDLPSALATCLQPAEQAMTQFRRAGVVPVPAVQKQRKAVASYFRKAVTGNPRIMRFALEKLVAPRDRGAVIFVDFIGGSIVEVLVDVDYKIDTIEAMKLLLFRYLSKATPLTTFATRYRTSTAENDLLYNATKLELRCKNILDRKRCEHNGRGDEHTLPPSDERARWREAWVSEFEENPATE